MEILQSKKFKLPTLYFITDRKEINELPIGVPFFYGDERIKNKIIRLLEYEIIYQKALKTGLPFNFKMLLIEAGFTNIKDFDWEDTVYMEYVTDDVIELFDSNNDLNIDSFDVNSSVFEEYIEDGVAYVDIQKIKDLNVFPTWFVENIENAISTNIHNFAVFNSNMYNKKLEGMYGGLDLTSPDRNLLNMDWSSSIPKAIATSTAILAKWMAETFYCDIIITAHSTIFIPYEEIHNINMDELYEKYNGNQECKEYRRLITSDVKHYKTCIIFGDNHSVCDSWCEDTKVISAKDGKKLCKWKIDKLIAFHTTSDYLTPGYADWFSPIETEIVKDWVRYLNKNN
ncbi:MAG: hypothetical protein M0R17_04720 [Candidatus Omnitrophica bacterium]|jgi:hypothetical protein|nr:hypothetical protein [Candidatus Omnitrophota bacterium]